MKKEPTANWYAVYTKSRKEKKLYKQYIDAGINAYLPIIKTLKQWSDRKKKVELPMLPSYVFVKALKNELSNILTYEGAVGLVKHERKPAIIPNEQIMLLKKVEKHDLPVSLCSEKIKEGVSVKVVSGALKSYVGQIVEVKSKKRFRIAIKGVSNLNIDIQGAEIEVL